MQKKKNNALEHVTLNIVLYTAHKIRLLFYYNSSNYPCTTENLIWTNWWNLILFVASKYHQIYIYTCINVYKCTYMMYHYLWCYTVCSVYYFVPSKIPSQHLTTGYSSIHIAPPHKNTAGWHFSHIVAFCTHKHIFIYIIIEEDMWYARKFQFSLYNVPRAKCGATIRAYIISGTILRKSNCMWKLKNLTHLLTP